MFTLYCCLRPKANDLGITRVVVVLVVGLFVSKTHTTSLFLSLCIFYYFFFLFIIFYHHIYLSFYYICLRTQAYLSKSIYINILTFDNLPTYTNLHQHTYLPTCFLTNTYQPMSTHHLPTHLPVPIPKYQYIIAADPGAGVGLVFTVKLIQKGCYTFL